MPKKSKLFHHFSFRVSDYLYKQICKYTLDNDLSYSAFVRLAIAAYLGKRAVKQSEFNMPDVTHQNTGYDHDEPMPLGFYNG